MKQGSSFPEILQHISTPHILPSFMSGLGASRQACLGVNLGQNVLEGRFSSLTRQEMYLSESKIPAAPTKTVEMFPMSSFRDTLTSGQKSSISIRYASGRWVGADLVLLHFWDILVASSCWLSFLILIFIIQF